MLLVWKASGEVPEHPSRNQHFIGQQGKTPGRVERPTLDHTADSPYWLHLSPQHSQLAAPRERQTSKSIPKQNSFSVDTWQRTFPKLRATTTSDPSLQQHFSYRGFVEVLEEQKGEFESRFSDVTENKEIFNFIHTPFHVDVSCLTLTITQLCPGNRAALESEITELQTNSILQVELTAGVGHFWSLVSEAGFPSLKSLPQKVISLFMRTYACESTFSNMNTIKRKQRNQRNQCDCNNNLQIQHEESQGHASQLLFIPVLS